jgi:hypothetical protein
LNRTFSKEEVQMAKKHRKKCSPSMAIKEMQIKTTLRLGNTTTNKCWRGCKEVGTFKYCWWECKLVQSLWRPLKKLEIDLTYNPAIPFPGLYPKECESGYTNSPACPFLLEHYSQ